MKGGLLDCRLDDSTVSTTATIAATREYPGNDEYDRENDENVLQACSRPDVDHICNCKNPEDQQNKSNDDQSVPCNASNGAAHSG